MTLSDRAIRHMTDHDLWTQCVNLMLLYLLDDGLTGRQYELLCRLSREVQRRGRQDPKWMGCSCASCMSLWDRQRQA